MQINPEQYGRVQNRPERDVRVQNTAEQIITFMGKSNLTADEYTAVLKRVAQVVQAATIFNKVDTLDSVLSDVMLLDGTKLMIRERCEGDEESAKRCIDVLVASRLTELGTAVATEVAKFHIDAMVLLETEKVPRNILIGVRNSLEWGFHKGMVPLPYLKKKDNDTHNDQKADQETQ